MTMLVTLPRHTSIREDEVQLVVEGSLRRPPQCGISLSTEKESIHDKKHDFSAC